MTMSEAEGTRFQILSLDGGGILGMFSAAVLAKLEEDLGVRVTDHFDLITGTSTGGIIALGLGLGLRPREILQFYVGKGTCIFPRGLGLNRPKHLFRCKFSSAPLRQALQECLQDKRLADSEKRLVIPSYNLDDNDVYLFKTPHNERLKRDFKVPMWKVAMATSAAPTYFPAFREVDSIRLIDGGVWANNPTMVGIVEAVSMLGVPLDAIKVFSVGTFEEVAKQPRALNSGGLWGWRRAGIDVALRGQSVGAVAQAQHLLGKDRVHRLNPRVPAGLFAMDRVSTDELLSKAAHHSRIFGPTFEREFTPYTAPRYTPLFT